MLEQPPERWPQQITCKVCTMRVTNPLMEQWEEGKRSGFIVSVVCGPCRSDMMTKGKYAKKIVWMKRRNEGTLIAGEKSADMSKKSTPVGVNAEQTYDNVSDQEVARIMAEIDADLDAEYGPKDKPLKRLVLDDY